MILFVLFFKGDRRTVSSTFLTLFETIFVHSSSHCLWKIVLTVDTKSDAKTCHVIGILLVTCFAALYAFVFDVIMQCPGLSKMMSRS